MNMIKDIAVDSMLPDRQNAEGAAQMLFNWKDCAAENESEYFSRTRKIRLIKIMKAVIENELEDQQKTILKMKHFENKSYEEIGRTLFMNPSTAMRNAKKAENTISLYMKYVLLFSDMKKRDDDPPLDIKTAIASLMLENATDDKIGARLKRARNEKLIPLKKAAMCTGIPESRIKNIEETGGVYSSELKRLISFYAVSADYIIFGAE